MCLKIVVHESLLHESLTVVEHAVNFYGRDILSKRRKLTFLERTDLSLRIQHVDMDAFHPEEAVGHGRAGVARCGYEHIHLLGRMGIVVGDRPILSHEIAQQTGHEAGTDIFEWKSSRA